MQSFNQLDISFIEHLLMLIDRYAIQEQKNIVLATINRTSFFINLRQRIYI